MASHLRSQLSCTYTFIDIWYCRSHMK